MEMWVQKPQQLCFWVVFGDIFCWISESFWLDVHFLALREPLGGQCHTKHLQNYDPSPPGTEGPRGRTAKFVWRFANHGPLAVITKSPHVLAMGPTTAQARTRVHTPVSRLRTARVLCLAKCRGREHVT